MNDIILAVVLDRPVVMVNSVNIEEFGATVDSVDREDDGPVNANIVLVSVDIID